MKTNTPAVQIRHKKGGAYQTVVICFIAAFHFIRGVLCGEGVVRGNDRCLLSVREFAVKEVSVEPFTQRTSIAVFRCRIDHQGICFGVIKISAEQDVTLWCRRLERRTTDIACIRRLFVD